MDAHRKACGVEREHHGSKTINRIGYAAMQLAGPGGSGPPRDPGAVRALLRRAVALGADHIDTSGDEGGCAPRRHSACAPRAALRQWPEEQVELLQRWIDGGTP
jgi:hypothetical protein